MQRPKNGICPSSRFTTKQAAGSRAIQISTSNVDSCRDAISTGAGGRFSQPEISTLMPQIRRAARTCVRAQHLAQIMTLPGEKRLIAAAGTDRSEEHTSELQSHS